jgi:hypothetical protein
MFFRVKPARGYRYLQIARSVRVEGKVRQEIIATLGRLDVLQESGQLDRLLRSGLRYCRQVKVLDAHAAGETEPVSIIKIGPELVFGRLWQDMCLAEIIRELAAERRYGFELERAVYLTVLHRLFISGSDRAAEAWKENYSIPGAEELALQHLYRAMAWLGEEIGEGVLGTPRCTKDLIEEALFDRGRDLFSEVGLLFFDTTSIYFEGAGGQSLGEYGHSKDHRPDLRQMVVGVALDVEGRPICCEMWPGNTADAKSLLPVVERMRAKFRVREMCVVADRGMVSEATLEALGRMEPPVHYIVGVRMRRTREVGEIVLRSRARWQEVTPERQRAKDPAPLKVKEVEVEGRRYVVCLNEEERRKDAHDRATILEALREQLRRGDKSLIGNKGYRRFLKIEGGGHFIIDEKQVALEERYDGLFVLRTTPTTTRKLSPAPTRCSGWLKTASARQRASWRPVPSFISATKPSAAMSSAASWPWFSSANSKSAWNKRASQPNGPRSCVAWTTSSKSNSSFKAAAFCFAVNSRAMPLKPSAQPKSPSRPS